MTPQKIQLEVLRSELAHAEEAERVSDEQVRSLPDILNRACAGGADAPSGADAARIVSAALTLNERLKEQSRRIRVALEAAERAARSSQRA